MVVHRRLAHSSHRPQLSIIVVVIHHHCHVVSSLSTCLHHHRVAIVACCQCQRWQRARWRGSGWWVLQRLLGIVAIRWEKKGGRAYNLLTCPMHAAIAIWTMWHTQRGATSSSPCAVDWAGARCCCCGWCVCVGQGRFQRVRWRSMCMSFSPSWALTMQSSSHKGVVTVMGKVVAAGGKLCLYLCNYKLCLCLVTRTGWDQLDWSLVGLKISEIIRDWRLDWGCGLWQSWEFLVFGSLGPVQSRSFSSLGTGLPSTTGWGGGQGWRLAGGSLYR